MNGMLVIKTAWVATFSIKLKNFRLLNLFNRNYWTTVTEGVTMESYRGVIKINKRLINGNISKIKRKLYQ